MTTRKRIGSALASSAIFAAGLAAITDASADSGPGAPAFLQAAQRGEVQPPDAEDIEHMCALLASCSDLPLPPQLVPEDFAKCVRKTSDDMASPSALNFSLTLRECGLRTNSCSEIRKCLLRGVKPDACKGRGQSGVTGLCDADGRAITCFKDRILAVRDCQRGNELCSVRDGQAACSLGPCSEGGRAEKPGEKAEPGGATCSPSGTRILQCEKGRLTGLDCAAFGLRCVAGPEGAACAAPTATCQGNAKRCDGTSAVGCFNGHEVKIDCGAVGLTCSGATGAGGAVGACTAPAPQTGACDAGAPARCDGAAIKYCLAGKPRSYFCKSLGFNKCVSDGKGARCAN